MESNITNQKYFDGELQLAEPHFDEEATLLSARPVVPLQNIKAEERSGKRLAFGAAMVFSLLVGALGATFIYKQRGQKHATAIVNTAIAGANGFAVEEPGPLVTDDLGTVATGTLQGSDTPISEAQSAPVASHSAKSSSVSTKEKESRTNVDERRLRQAERIEARRLKPESAREAQNEARGHKSRPSDLLRIREIFEGSQRP